MKKAYFFLHQPSYMNWDVCFNTGGDQSNTNTNTGTGTGTGGDSDSGTSDRPTHDRPDDADN